MTQYTRREWLAGASAFVLGGCASGVRRETERVDIPTGSGQFEISGGKGREARRITIYCHRPASFTRRSPILLVVPGAGRNGDDYRDVWVKFADAAGVLVVSPSYPESAYDAAAYQLGGVIENLVVGKPLPESTPTSVYLRDEDIRFDVNPRQDEWLFHDFERLFDVVVNATGSRQRQYDAFGHSAGGQVLHRHALLAPRSRARRIVAGNSGFYTLPELDTPLPTGLAGLGLDDDTLRRAFARDLTILLGENDNDPDRGGSHLHTPTLDRQGRHRLARGQHFFRVATERARKLGADFRWKLQIVPGVGHDYRGMTAAAAKLMYGV